jgi:hypothetical protein
MRMRSMDFDIILFRNKVFKETCIMVRDPAVEIIKYINQSDLSQPAVRYRYLLKCGKQCCGAGAARSRIFWSEPEP